MKKKISSPIAITIIVACAVLSGLFLINVYKAKAEYSCSPSCDYGCREGKCASEPETYSWTECLSLEDKNCDEICGERGLIAFNSCIDSKGTKSACMELWVSGGCGYEEGTNTYPCYETVVTEGYASGRCCCGQVGLKYIEDKLVLIKATISRIIEDIKELKKLTTSSMKVYRSDSFGFEIKYPASWLIEKVISEGKVIFYEKENPEKSVSVSVDSFSPNIEDFIKESEKITSVERTNIDGYPAVLLGAEGATGGSLNVFKDRERFVIECHFTALEIWEKIIPTFKFILSATELTERAQNCAWGRGTILKSLCCKTSDHFPNLCVVGACGCSIENSHEVLICDCGKGRCFDGERCVDVSSE